MFRFLLKLLQGDKSVLGLMGDDPWKGDEQRPKYIRVEMYRYKFHKRTREERGSKSTAPCYWDREWVAKVYPRQGVVTAEVLKEETRKRRTGQNAY